MAEHEAALPPARHEQQDIVFRYLVVGLAGTLAAVVLCLLLIMWIYPSIEVDKRLAGPLPPYPKPMLQSDPTAAMQRFRRSELEQLNSSGWVDRAQGIAHIPISEAMERIVQQGIPDWPTP